MPSDPTQPEPISTSGRSTEIPEPIRAAAGLAATVLDQARQLPSVIAGLPVKVAGMAMQASLRLQQGYAGLVVKGDELLIQITSPDDADPPWATFDEDVVDVAESVSDAIGLDTTAATAGPAEADVALPPFGGATRRRPRRSSPAKLGHSPSAFDLAEDASSPTTDSGSTRSPAAGTSRNGKRSTSDAPVPGYDSFTLAQLRARLRTFDAATLQGLVAYEREQRARVPYLTLLENRLNRGRQQG